MRLIRPGHFGNMAPRRRGGLVQLRDGNQLDVETALRQYGLPAPPHFRTVKLLPL